MVKRGHVVSHERGHKLRTATIIDAVRATVTGGAELHVLTYEGLSEGAMRQWLPLVGLEYVGGPLELVGQDSPNWIQNANAKHYDEG